MSDDLFQPTLQQRPVPTGELPWRVGSQLYVAFFGGPFALAWIASRNAARLGLPDAERRRITMVGIAAGVIVGLAVGIWFALALPEGFTLADRAGLADARRLPRLVSRVSGALLYLPFKQWQTGAERRWEALHGPDAYASAWVPGLVAVFGVGLVQIVPFAVGVAIGWLLR